MKGTATIAYKEKTDRATLWHSRTPRSVASLPLRGRIRSASASTCTSSLEQEIAEHGGPAEHGGCVLDRCGKPSRRRPECFDGGCDEQHCGDAVEQDDRFPSRPH